MSSPNLSRVFKKKRRNEKGWLWSRVGGAVAAGVKMETAMASIATGFHVSLGRLLRSQGRLALMATAGIIFPCVAKS